MQKTSWGILNEHERFLQISTEISTSKTFYLFHNLDSANKKSFEPDKNFIESLKDAMRTVVNYKERGAQRAKAPDFLALYSDQLLKGKV